LYQTIYVEKIIEEDLNVYKSYLDEFSKSNEEESNLEEEFSKLSKEETQLQNEYDDLMKQIQTHKNNLEKIENNRQQLVTLKHRYWKERNEFEMKLQAFQEEW
jgi:predicted  nucleic acid-binding Zn-ribbon protein